MTDGGQGFRNLSLNIAVAFTFGGLAAIFAVTASETSTGGTVVASLVAAYWFVSAVKAFRAGVYVNVRGVTVRGYNRTRRVAWADVAGVTTAPGSPLNSQTVLIGIKTRDGRSVCSQGFGARVHSWKKGERLAQLEDAVESCRPRPQQQS